MYSTKLVREYYALTRRAFDALAPYYDLATLPLGRVRRLVAKKIHLPAGASILDVATGTGQQAFAFARRGYVVTAIDLTDSMLQVARHHNQRGLVQFEPGDATRLRFPDASFDATSISFALHDMPAIIRGQVLREMVRVTRRDGCVLIVDYGLPRNPLGRWLVYNIVSRYEAEYYREFIALDLPRELAACGIRVWDDSPLLLGIARIWQGAKVSGPLPGK